MVFVCLCKPCCWRLVSWKSGERNLSQRGLAQWRNSVPQIIVNSFDLYNQLYKEMNDIITVKVKMGYVRVLEVRGLAFDSMSSRASCAMK